jgi:hypothetical protein
MRASSVRARSKATFGPASGLLVDVIGELALSTNAFRVAAPLATQRTELEENGRSDAGAVIGTKVLDVQHFVFN